MTDLLRDDERKIQEAVGIYGSYADQQLQLLIDRLQESRRLARKGKATVAAEVSIAWTARQPEVDRLRALVTRLREALELLAVEGHFANNEVAVPVKVWNIARAALAETEAAVAEIRRQVRF